MAKTDFKTVDELIATFPADVQEKLEEIRRTIRQAIPESEEAISYQMAAYKLNGPVVYFTAFTHHVSLASPPPTLEAFKDELADYKTSVSVVQFPFDKPMPHELITKIAKFKAQENVRKKK